MECVFLLNYRIDEWANIIRFLLAQLHLNSLIGKRSPKAVRAALEKLPKGSEAYNQAYRQTMERIEKQGEDPCELAKQVLSWITYAKRPMTALELQHALTVEIGESELDEENTPDIKDMVSVCAGLVTIDEESNIIRLVHYTTQEFFERNQNDWFPDAEVDIARICVTYLSFDVFESGFCLSDQDFEDRLRLNPFYDYAARNWGHHIREASDAHFPIPIFLEQENKVSSCSQAMMVHNHYRKAYSRHVPKQTIGVHLTTWFGLTRLTSELIRNGCPSDCKNEYGRTPLSYAAEHGHEGVVKLLMTRNNVDINSKNKYGRTPLLIAASNGQEGVVKLLMTRDNVDINSKNNYDETPLLAAASRGHEKIVKLLMTQDSVNINSKNNYGETPLLTAASKGHEKIIKLLMTRDNVDIDSKNIFGQTPLFVAASSGHVRVVKLLMTLKNVDINSKDKYGQTAQNVPELKGHQRVVELIECYYDAHKI